MKKIITKTIDITPDMAAEMIEHNTMNRNISQLNVTRYANDMASGAWEQNGETIKIAEDGTVLDGQHRLWAIIESGMTVTMIVVYNVRKEAVGSIDSGVIRLFHHLLKIKGSAHYITAATITKLAWIYDNYDKQMRAGSAKAETRNSILEPYYDENRDLIEQAAAVAECGAHHFVKSHMGFCFYLFLRRNPLKAEEFIKLVKSGENLHTGHPIMTLRGKLMDNRMSKNKLTVRETLAYYTKAWNAFLKGRDLSIFRWNNTEELPEVK